MLRIIVKHQFFHDIRYKIRHIFFPRHS